jgi:predicted Zn-dependent peptidase
MNRAARSAIALLLLGGVAACHKASAMQDERLPGRTRPVLEHGWPHPRDLQFRANAFQPPDAKAALIVTPSGLKAYIVRAADDPIVQIAAAIPLGRVFERPAEAGASELIGRQLQQHVGRALGETFIGRVQMDQDADLTRITVQAPAAEWRRSTAAVVGALRDARIDPAGIDAYRTGPGFLRPTRGTGGAGFRPAVELARLSAAFPIAPPDAGRTIARDAVTGLAARALVPQSIALGIGGDVARQDVERALQDMTAGWTNAAAPPQPPAIDATRATELDRVWAERRRFHAIDEPGFTTWIAIGHATASIATADEAAVAVMTEILNIRLNITVREMRGLANQAILQMPATTRHAGLLHVRTAGRPESVAPLVQFSKQELSRIRENDGTPTAEELEQAKGGLVLSQWQRALDGARAATATYANETARYGSLDRLNGWPAAVRAVTAAQVTAAARRYIEPAKLGTVLIGQLDAVRKARHPRWPAEIAELR